MSHPLPKTLSFRLEQVGKALYGERWRNPLARAIGVSRTSIHIWMKGHRPNPDLDIDGRLLDLVRRRGLMPEQLALFAKLERELAAFVKEKA